MDFEFFFKYAAANAEVQKIMAKMTEAVGSIKPERKFKPIGIDNNKINRLILK